MRGKNSGKNRLSRRFVAGKSVDLAQNPIYWHWKHQLTLTFLKNIDFKAILMLFLAEIIFYFAA